MNTKILKHTDSASEYNKNSITEGTIWKALLYFFFPILLGTFFQQLYNTIDTVVVGRYVGKTALAAVGGGSAVFVHLILGFFVGLTSGAGVLISQFYGAGRKKSLHLAVHTAYALSIAGGIIMTAFGIMSSSAILKITKTPPDTFELSNIYLRIYFIGLTPMFIYNMGSSTLRAIGNSRTPLRILIVGCLTNIILDLLFVLVFHMGVSGVAVATVLCQIECAVITTAVLMRTKDTYRLELTKIAFTPHILSKILKFGCPAGIQSCLYTFSNLIIQTFINGFGTNSVAAWAAYGKIDSVFWMMISSLGIALTTFSGQNFGAKKYSRIKKAHWESLFLAIAITLLFIAAFRISGRYLFLLFTDDSQVIAEGLKILYFLMPFWLTYISIEVVSGTIRGAGISVAPTVITIFGVCLLRIVWLFTAVPACNTMKMILASYPITWITTSIAFWIYYATSKNCKFKNNQ